jgi:hypothetical protein
MSNTIKNIMYWWIRTITERPGIKLQERQILSYCFFTALSSFINAFIHLFIHEAPVSIPIIATAFGSLYLGFYCAKLPGRCPITMC